MIRINHPVELAGVVIGAITPCKFATLIEQSGIDDVLVTGSDVVRVRMNTGHDFAPYSRVKRAEEEQFVFQTRDIATHVSTDVIVLFVKQVALLVDASIVSLATRRFESARPCETVKR